MDDRHESRYSEGRQDAQIEALIRTIDGIQQTLKDMQRNIPSLIEDKIAPVRKAVLGNGTPRQGLAARIEWHDKMLKFVLGIISALFIAFLVAQFTHL